MNKNLTAEQKRWRNFGLFLIWFGGFLLGFQTGFQVLKYIYTQ